MPAINISQPHKRYYNLIPSVFTSRAKGSQIMSQETAMDNQRFAVMYFR